MLKFTKLEIHNFLSIGEAVLDFPNDTDFILIAAENHRIADNSASNGGGKSSLFEALIWAITGETIRGFKEVVNKYQEKDCFVEVNFTFKNINWIVKRTRYKKGGQALSIWKNNEELSYKGLRDAEAALSKELPELTMKFLGSTVILGQGLPQRFTNNSPSGRKAVLEELANADFMIEHVKENIKKRESFLSTELRRQQDLELTLTSTKNMLVFDLERQTYAEADYMKTDLSSMQKRLLALEVEGKEEAGKNSQLAEFLKLAEEEYQTQKNKRLEAIAFVENELAECKLLYEKKRGEEAARLSDEKQVKFVSILMEKQEIEKQIFDLDEKLKQALSIISGGVCSKCGQTLAQVSADTLMGARKEAIYFETNKKELLSKKDSILERENNLNIEYRNLLFEFDKTLEIDLENNLKNIRNLAKENIDLLQELEEKAIARLASKSEEYRASNRNLENLRIEYRVLANEIKVYEESLKTIRERISELKKQIAENIVKIEKAESDILVIQERLKVIRSMDNFASRDFRGILLENILLQLDFIMKKLAEKVYKEPLTKIYQEGNAIEISFDDKEYESLSGGEKQKLDVIVQLSLRALIIQTSGIEANLAVFDEVFDALDKRGCEAIMDILMDLGLQTYIITHRSELAIPYDRIITVIKDENGIARLA